MFKYKKTWTAKFNNHQIVVENWWDLLFRTGERLIIDKKVVDEQKSWSGFSRLLNGKISSNNETHNVKVRLGNINYFSKVGCHIFVDEKLIGGDIDKKLLT